MAVTSTPIFATADVEASMKFYIDVLGFSRAWAWGDPPTIGAVSLGAMDIMLSYQPELAQNVAGHEHWISLDNADELYAKHLEQGAKILSPLEDKPWGVREYTVEDPSGYHLRFTGPPSGQAAPSKPFPAGVTIEHRRPTAAEYARVIDAPDRNVEALFESAWNGVVALSPEGVVIGTVRIMHDAPGWFSIWDVAVEPDWQGQRIGQRLMEEAVALIKEASPGAWVYLFTTKHGFYEKVGFAEGTVTMMRV